MELCIFDLSARFTALKNMIADSNLRELVERTIPVGFYDAPGAMKHHHNYRHGLWQHTVEVAEYSVSMLECNTDDYTDYDFDVLLVAALLHDVAKVDEYSIDITTGVIMYGDFSIGHLVKSVMWMVGANATSPKVLASNKMQDRIAEVMLAHHGFVNWGTPKTCAVDNKRATLLQAIIHSADMVSAN
jgi:3'-5' exoribonuclease